jgi:hypothetical protein
MLILTQDKSTVCAEHTIARKSFWMNPMVLLGGVGHVEALSVCLEIVLILMEDRCTFCAEDTINSEIVLDTPDGTPM